MPPNRKSQSASGWLLCVLGAALLVWAAVPGFSRAEIPDRIVFVDQAIHIAPADTAVWKSGRDLALTIHEPTSDSPWVAVPSIGEGTLVLSKKEGAAISMHLKAISASYALLAGVGLFLVFLGLPMLSTRGRAWPDLLCEPAGGLSLAKTQLFIWFSTALIILAGLTFPLHSMPEISGALPLILALGGITTAVGTAASPSNASTAKADAPPVRAAPVLPIAGVTTGSVNTPQLIDLVTDWNNQADISRHQYLIITILGAAAILITFAVHLITPEVPASFYYLLIASQSTYLGTKAVKAAANPNL